MRTQHIIYAWIGTLLIGSLLVYPADSLIEKITGVETFANATDYWKMAISYGVVALILSLPTLFLALILREPLRTWLRYEHQFDALLIVSLVGIWVGAFFLNHQLEAALAYTVGATTILLALRFEPLKRRSTLVL